MLIEVVLELFIKVEVNLEWVCCQVLEETTICEGVGRVYFLVYFLKYP